MANFPFQKLQAELGELLKKYPNGSRLPSEPDLAKMLGVSRATLREAMRMFETQGQIRRRQGSGTFVVGTPTIIDDGLEILESMLTLARRTGQNVGPGPVEILEITADSETASQLEIAEGSEIVRIARTMSADTRPVAYLVDELPSEVLCADELKTKFNGSVLDFLIKRGDPLTISYTNITAVNASTQVAKKLEIQRGDVLLQFTAKLYTASGRVVDYSHSYFLPGYFNFHIVRRVEKNSL